MRTRLNIEPFSTKTNQGRFYFQIGHNSLSRAKDLAAVNHVTQAGVRVGLNKVGFKELRLEPKFLHRGLRIQTNN